MQIYVFSDFQGEKIVPNGNPDLVILLGDIYYRDALELDQKYNCPKIGVYGNHDSQEEWSETSIKVIHEEIYEYCGVTFSGFGGCPKYNSKPNQFTDSQCREFMSNLDKVDVFLSHSNPNYDLTLPDWDPHRGFSSFNTYIKEKQPNFFLHGHIHNPFTLEVGKTKIYSVYPFLELNI